MDRPFFIIGNSFLKKQSFLDNSDLHQVIERVLLREARWMETELSQAVYQIVRAGIGRPIARSDKKTYTIILYDSGVLVYFYYPIKDYFKIDEEDDLYAYVPIDERTKLPLSHVESIAGWSYFRWI